MANLKYIGEGGKVEGAVAGESPGTEAVATPTAGAVVFLTRLTVKFGFKLVGFRNLELN